MEEGMGGGEGDVEERLASGDINILTPMEFLK